MNRAARRLNLQTLTHCVHGTPYRHGKPFACKRCEKPPDTIGQPVDDPTVYRMKAQSPLVRMMVAATLADAEREAQKGSTP